ncbi:MAG: cytochrome c, class [Acidobacteria bacterium]|nr:cytochrome c, class [Acidobacteriota bacterium]
MPRLGGKMLTAIVILVLAVISVGVTFTIGWRPFIGPRARALSDRHFEPSSARLERGKYLVNSVMGCLACHTEIDFSKPGSPPVAGRLGAGKRWADATLPWVVAPNITPDKDSGAGNWTDDMLARAIREGIGHDGRALFSLMPYESYRSMSDEDLASVIVYVRSLPAVRNQLPVTQIPFPINFLINNVPQPVNAQVAAPDQSTPVARGAYLVKMGICADCHTPKEKGQPIAGMDFAGGLVFSLPTGVVASANITPDASGISYYDEDLFVHSMREGKVGARQLNFAMPWLFYGKMTDDDLKSMFAFLRTLKPVKHRVDNAVPPTFCQRCRQRHGLGENN